MFGYFLDILHLYLVLQRSYSLKSNTFYLIHQQSMIFHLKTAAAYFVWSLLSQKSKYLSPCVYNTRQL